MKRRAIQKLKREAGRLEYEWRRAVLHPQTVKRKLRAILGVLQAYDYGVKEVKGEERTY